MTSKNISPALLRACIKGDRKAQRQLYEAYYGWGLKLCLRYASNKDEAKEMVNDGFLKILTKLDKKRADSPLAPWMRSIFIYTAIDYLRWQKKHKLPIDAERVPEQTSQPIADNQLQYEEVLKAVQALPPSYRLVFNLYEMEGYSHADIAKQLNISEGTSRSNLMRAKEKLRTMLAKYDQGIIKLPQWRKNNNSGKI